MKELVPKKSWGNTLWKYIHSICVIDLETPEDNYKESKEIVKILKNITNIIPCDHCSKEWKNNLPSLEKIDLHKPLVLFHWSWKIHNKINRKLDKPTITYEEALRIHTKEK